MKYSVDQRQLHDIQLAIIRSGAKRKVVATGRRCGKTTVAGWESVERAIRGGRVLFGAPTLDQIEFYWKYVTDALYEPIEKGVIYKHEGKHLLEFPRGMGGGRIRAKTAYNADTLRGDYADFLILEEYALMNPDAWEYVGQPMLLDNDGDAWFLSTTKRRNHFHKLFLRAKEDERGRWEAFHATSHSNPYLSKIALEEIMQDMTDEARRQEIMAEFLEGEGMVFRNVDKVCVLEKGHSGRNDHKGHTIVAGLDFGKKGDYTLLSIGCQDCKKELDFYRANKVDYTYQKKMIDTFVQKWRVDNVLAEANSMGEPMIDHMKELGIPVKGFTTTAQSKPILIETLQLAFETQSWKFLDDEIGKTEHEAYEVSYSKLGRPSYEGASGVHDDFVMGRALMVYEAENYSDVFIDAY